MKKLKRLKNKTSIKSNNEFVKIEKNKKFIITNQCDFLIHQDF